nr:putative reverse transcriptase, RNA-dependent DNA polymerase, Gag-polypeptide of LTR copia-type [Tanacetum cinerariifolium]
MESKFVALDATGKEAEWLRNFIHEILIWPKPIAPIYIHYDSAATLAKAYSQIYNGKSRHLGVGHSMIRELIKYGVISIDFVQLQHNLADHLMKEFARDLVIKNPSNFVLPLSLIWLVVCAFVFLSCFVIICYYAIGDASGSNPDLINNLDAGNPLHMNPHDSTSSALIPFKLLGTKNYCIWNNAMKLALQAWNKFQFVDGSCVKYAYKTSPVLSVQRDRCNAIVLTWIINSVFSNVYMGLVYSVNAASVVIKQGDSSVADYYHRLNSLWREFDALTKLPACTCDANEELALHNQLMKLMQFLMGLDDYYQSVRSVLLTRDPLPDIKDAYTIVFREESHRGILEPSNVTESKINATSFATKGFNSSASQTSSSTSFTPEQIRKLLSLINDFSISVHANMSGRASFFNGNVWLDHPADQVLLVLKNDLGLSKTTSATACEVYHRAKQTRDPFPLSDHKSEKLGELIHLDLWGPYRVTSREGFKYFLTIVDDFSRAMWVYLIKTKDEVFDVFVAFVKMIHNQFKIAYYVLNGKSPYELVHKNKPNLSHLRSFGCLCFSKVLNNSDKFTSRSDKCVFFGYSSIKKAYNLFSLDSISVVFSRDVEFYETVFPFKMKSNSLSDVADVDFTNEVYHLTFFDNQLTQSPNDEERATLVEEGSPSFSETDTTHQENGSAAQINDNSLSEGNMSHSQSIFSNIPTHLESSKPIDNVQYNVRRTYRVSKFPPN